MQEYIIFAILIFFPIGALMDYLLRRDGLLPKYRIVIITASLAIIISFPILMGTIGLPIALIIYVAAILLLIWYFIRASKSQSWYLRQGTAATNDEVYVSDRFIDMTKVQTVGDLEDAIWPKEEEQLVVEPSTDLIESAVPEDDNNENEVRAMLFDQSDSIAGGNKLTEDKANQRETKPTNRFDAESVEAKLTKMKTEALEKLPEIVTAGEELSSIAVSQSEESTDKEDTVPDVVYVQETENIAADATDKETEIIEQTSGPDVDRELSMDFTTVAENEAIAVDATEIQATEIAADKVEEPEAEVDERLMLLAQTTDLNDNEDTTKEIVSLPEKEIAAVLNAETISIEDWSVEPIDEAAFGLDSENEQITEIPKSDMEQPLLDAAPDQNGIENEGIEESDQSELNLSYEEPTGTSIHEQVPELTVNTFDSQSSLEKDRVNDLIDHGFGLKNEQRFMEALACFNEALDLTIDEDLYYLLLMEMVNIYKDKGMYAQAEELLFLSIGKGPMRTDIIYEIDRQLSYIRLLSVELDRLGLANTPISEVPRSVRMNVAEIVEL